MAINKPSQIIGYVTSGRFGYLLSRSRCLFRGLARIHTHILTVALILDNSGYVNLACIMFFLAQSFRRFLCSRDGLSQSLSRPADYWEQPHSLKTAVKSNVNVVLFEVYC